MICRTDEQDGRREFRVGTDNWKSVSHISIRRIVEPLNSRSPLHRVARVFARALKFLMEMFNTRDLLFPQREDIVMTWMNIKFCYENLRKEKTFINWYLFNARALLRLNYVLNYDNKPKLADTNWENARKI